MITLLRICVVFCLALLVELAFYSPNGAAAQDGTDNRDKIASWFRHLEGVVNSIEAEFEDRLLPTTPEQAANIRKAVHEWNEGNQYSRYIISTDRARAGSYVEHWWRKGSKERHDTFYNLDADISQMEPETTLAYDGEVVRTLNHHNVKKNGPVALVENEKTARWFRMNRVHPFSFLYVFCEVPYSRVIQEASMFRTATVNRDGKSLLQVSFSCSGEELGHTSLVLLFDDTHRLLERQEFTKISPNNTELTESHTFSDYRSHVDSSGETIWFPHEATYRHYAKLPSDGSAVEMSVHKIKIRSIRFNVEIPDEFFELRIPKNAKLYDGIMGLGWLPEGERPDILFPTEARTRRWTWIAVGTIIAVLVLASIVVRRRRNARRVSPSPGGN